MADAKAANGFEMKVLVVSFDQSGVQDVLIESEKFDMSRSTIKSNEKVK